jgi:hypothetical protein
MMEALSVFTHHGTMDGRNVSGRTLRERETCELRQIKPIRFCCVPAEVPFEFAMIEKDGNTVM